MTFDDQTRFPAHERLAQAGPLAELPLAEDRPVVFVDHSFLRLEIELHGEPAVPRLEVVSAFEWPQVNARYVVTQPEVLARDPRQGWAPVGGSYPANALIGPREAGQFTFPAGTGLEDQLLVCAEESFLSLTACGAMTATLRVPVGDLLTAAEAGQRLQRQAA